MPDGDYVLMESFCDNPDCDCLNAFIYITTAPPEVKNMAGINYGWESRQYYESIFADEERANQVHGVHLLEGMELGPEDKEALQTLQSGCPKGGELGRADLGQKEDRQE